MAELEPDNSAVSDVDEGCDADGGAEVTHEDTERSDKENQTVRSKHKFEVSVCLVAESNKNAAMWGREGWNESWEGGIGKWKMSHAII
jgi:hypothetical protein